MVLPGLMSLWLVHFGAAAAADDDDGDDGIRSAAGPG